MRFFLGNNLRVIKWNVLKMVDIYFEIKLNFLHGTLLVLMMLLYIKLIWPDKRKLLVRKRPLLTKKTWKINFWLGAVRKSRAKVLLSPVARIISLIIAMLTTLFNGSFIRLPKSFPCANIINPSPDFHL